MLYKWMRSIPELGTVFQRIARTVFLIGPLFRWRLTLTFSNITANDHRLWSCYSFRESPFESAWTDTLHATPSSNGIPRGHEISNGSVFTGCSGLLNRAIDEIYNLSIQTYQWRHSATFPLSLSSLCLQSRALLQGFQAMTKVNVLYINREMKKEQKNLGVNLTSS